MKCKLECDVCGINFSIPFLPITQQLNCLECDFSILWDGEVTKTIVEKSLSFLHNGIQYRACADLTNEELVVDVEFVPDTKGDPTDEGKIAFKMSLKGYESIKLDYNLCKKIFK